MEIDASRCVNIDHDCYEILTDFKSHAAARGIDLTVTGLSTCPEEHGSAPAGAASCRRAERSDAAPLRSGIA